MNITHTCTHKRARALTKKFTILRPPEAKPQWMVVGCFPLNVAMLGSTPVFLKASAAPTASIYPESSFKAADNRREAPEGPQKRIPWARYVTRPQFSMAPAAKSGTASMSTLGSADRRGRGNERGRKWTSKKNGKKCRVQQENANQTEDRQSPSHVAHKSPPKKSPENSGSHTGREQYKKERRAIFSPAWGERGLRRSRCRTPGRARRTAGRSRTWRCGPGCTARGAACRRR